MAVDADKLKRPGKGTPPAPETAIKNNLARAPSGAKVPIQFHIPPEMKREIDIYAIEHEYKTISDLLGDLWQHWKATHG